VIPLYHDFTGETVLVFGGGTVGSRKASRFADEARVVVVSPGFDDRLVDLAEEDRESVELVRATPDAEAIHGWIDRVDPSRRRRHGRRGRQRGSRGGRARHRRARRQPDRRVGRGPFGRPRRAERRRPGDDRGRPGQGGALDRGRESGAREGAPRAGSKRRSTAPARWRSCQGRSVRSSKTEMSPRNVGKRSAASCDPRGFGRLYKRGFLRSARGRFRDRGGTQ